MTLKENRGKAAAAIAVSGALVLGAFGLAGCSSGGATAATVNGEALPEETVTEYIDQFRTSNDLDDDTAWAQWMVDNSYDASSIRDTAIDYYVRQMVIAQDAKNHGVSVSDDEVDQQVNEIRENYQLDDQGWIDQLESVGYTEESYRDYVKNSLLSDKLEDVVITDVDVTDDEVLEMANMYASYIDGTADVSVIAMPVDDPDAANNVSSQIKDGSLSFDDAKAQNSTTDDFDGVANMNGLETAVTDQIANMSPGDISDPIAGIEHIYIIRVDDIIDAPEGEDNWTSVDQLPQGVYNTFHDQVYSSNSYSAFDSYVQNLINNADIQKNDMPADAPYNVSTEGLTPSEEATGAVSTSDSTNDTADDGSSDGSTDDTADGDASAETADEGTDGGEGSGETAGE